MLDIAYFLKKCRKGTKLYSPIFGECTLDHVKEGVYPGFDDVIYVNVEIGCQKQFAFDNQGRFSFNINSLGECLLFPSNENRDWVEFNRSIENKKKNKKHNFEDIQNGKLDRDTPAD